jgi:hypothetical protein
MKKIIPELEPVRKMKRTALYISQEDYALVEAFAEAQGCSVNRASVFALKHGLEALGVNEKSVLK